jgi:hypothetical protein
MGNGLERGEAAKGREGKGTKGRREVVMDDALNGLKGADICVNMLISEPPFVIQKALTKSND